MQREADGTITAHGGSPRRVTLTCVLVLASVWCLTPLVNWLWLLSRAPHSRALLVVLAVTGVMVGSVIGLAVSILWHVVAMLRPSSTPRPSAFALAAALLGAPALGLFLKALSLLPDLPQPRLMAVGLFLLWTAVMSAAVVAMGRWVERALDRFSIQRLATAQSKVAALAVAGLAIVAGIYVATRHTVADGPEASRPPRAARAGLPHIILVSFDTLRPDHLSFSGYRRPTSPRIDAAIEEGAVFTQTIASSSWTIPSHATLFTGASPSRLGRSMMERADSGSLHLPEEAETITEILRAQGYRTAAFIASAAMHAVFGFDQGFEVYDQLIPPSMPAYAGKLFFGEEICRLSGTPRMRCLEWLTPSLIAVSNAIYGQAHVDPPAGYREFGRSPQRMWSLAREVNGKVRGYLDTFPAGPLFLFVHYFDVHSPFDAPAPFGGRWGNDGSGFGYIFRTGLFDRVSKQGISLTPAEAGKLAGTYDEEIASMDHAFGELLDLLEERKVLDDSILIMFSDHGESLGDHGDLFHGNSLHEELIQILFAIRSPRRVAAGRRIDLQVGAVDILPTLLDLAGLETKGAPPWEGHSLASLLRSGVAEPMVERPVFSELYAGGMRGLDTGSFGMSMHSVRDGGWKFVLGSDGSHRLHHLAVDPREEIDYYAAEPVVAARLETLLAGWLAGSISGDEATHRILQERIEKLKSLGYVGGGD